MGDRPPPCHPCAVTTRWVHAAGTRLACEVIGNGFPVVLVHAGITDAGMWDGVVRPLAGAHRTIRYDLRGFGRSEPTPGEFSHVEDLAAVVTQLADGPAHLVGASLGGRIALDLAVTRPSLVSGLALLGSAVSGVEPEIADPPLWDELLGAHRSGDVQRLADVEARMWLADPEGTRVPEVLERVRRMDAAALAQQRKANARERPIDPPAGQRLGDVRLPVPVAVGSLELEDIRLTADLLTERLPLVERVDLPGVAHLPALEAPDRVADLLLDFFARVAASPSHSGHGTAPDQR